MEKKAVSILWTIEQWPEEWEKGSVGWLVFIQYHAIITDWWLWTRIFSHWCMLKIHFYSIATAIDCVRVREMLTVAVEMATFSAISHNPWQKQTTSKWERTKETKNQQLEIAKMIFCRKNVDRLLWVYAYMHVRVFARILSRENCGMHNQRKWQQIK